MTPVEEKTIPYFVHEGEMIRMERTNRRWFIAFLILLAALILTNAAWIYHESQYETYAYEQEVQSDSSYAVALMNTGEGSVNYNGDGNKTEDHGPGPEDQQQQPDEDLP